MTDAAFDLGHDSDNDGTGKLAVRIAAAAKEAKGSSAPATKEEFALLADAVGKLLEHHQRERGSRIVVRAFTGIAMTIALALGGAALNYAQQAASDHERLDRVAADTVRNSEAIEDHRTVMYERGTDIATRVERIDALLTRVDASLQRWEETTRALDARITTLERDRRR